MQLNHTARPFGSKSPINFQGEGSGLLSPTAVAKLCCLLSAAVVKEELAVLQGLFPNQEAERVELLL